MKKSIKSVVVLVCICMAVSALLAFTNHITAPIIKANEQKNANAALLELLPGGGSFELVDISGYTLPSTVTEVYRASNGGYVIKLSTNGYASGMVLMCGISADGQVVGTKLLSSNETPSIGGAAAKIFADKVIGKDKDSIDTVDTVADATYTTSAYRSAVRDALRAAYILQGGTVEIRTEEEIFAANLAAALPAAEGRFEKHFFVEVIEGVDAIYLAENESGAVCLIGEQFIGIDAEGQVLTECSAEDAAKAQNAILTLQATVTADIDLTAYAGLPSQLVWAKRTATGNYIIEIKAAGYGIVGGNEYHPASGKYIHILVSMTADGKIIDCKTLSQEETNGLGSACANESFYGQFVGKTEETYTDIDAIAKATITTEAYKTAILRAFQSVNIFEEGGNQE